MDTLTSQSVRLEALTKSKVMVQVAFESNLLLLDKSAPNVPVSELKVSTNSDHTYLRMNHALLERPPYLIHIEGDRCAAADEEEECYYKSRDPLIKGAPCCSLVG